MTSPKPAAAVDLDALKCAVDRSACTDANQWAYSDFTADFSPDVLRALIAELEQLRAGAPRWIACLEDMPSAGVPVLIRGHAWPSPVVASLVLDERLAMPSFWSDADGNGEVYYLDHVHYWSVLPELPESLREAEAPLPSPPEAVKP